MVAAVVDNRQALPQVFPNRFFERTDLKTFAEEPPLRSGVSLWRAREQKDIDGRHPSQGLLSKLF